MEVNIMTTVTFEHTDTFAGEANYSWLRRDTIEVPENVSELSIIRKAKAFAGFTGLDCIKENYGDMISLKPYGLCQILFINWRN
jgi:hypothetical protein